jgi:hypothetical protein
LGRKTLSAQLPHLPLTLNNHLTHLEGTGFSHGMLDAGRKLAPIAYQWRDPLVPELLGIEPAASASAWSPFIGGFTSGIPPAALNSPLAGTVAFWCASLASLFSQSLTRTNYPERPKFG